MSVFCILVFIDLLHEISVVFRLSDVVERFRDRLLLKSEKRATLALLALVSVNISLGKTVDYAIARACSPLSRLQVPSGPRHRRHSVPRPYLHGGRGLVAPQLAQHPHLHQRRLRLHRPRVLGIRIPRSVLPRPRGQGRR